MSDNTAPAPVLALRPRDAAKALGISERTLREWTKNGDIPHVRVDGGRAIIYPVDALRDWLRHQAEASKPSPAAPV
ncbi:MAG TPA: helix-turn-helix domain-containing protein [Pirellulales bacterium]|jgi:excisionase family DNA binding protein|nr:helix-turn-helix domain-containing protein [Pirellulales bacterium]